MACNDLNCWCNIDGKGHLKFDESEHDRTGGPNPHKTWINWAAAGIEFTEEESLGFTEADSIGVPLQEQIEQVEDALGKALTVIEAFVEQERDLRTLVYQAQLDAQDWQNKHNTVKSLLDYDRVTQAMGLEVSKRREREITNLRERLAEAETNYVDHTDGYKDDIGRLEGLLYDEKQKTASLALEAGEGAGNLMARILELTEKNTQLELVLEREDKIIRHLLSK